MKVLSVTFNFEELKKDLEEYSKQYDLSVGAKAILKGEYQVDRENLNKKWIIYLFDEGYIGFNLYESYCKNYLEKVQENMKNIQ